MKFQKGHKTNVGKFRTKNPSYSAIHYWLKRNAIKPETCSHCGQNKKLYWASVDHLIPFKDQYPRDISKYIALCWNCHYVFDNMAEKTRNKLKGKPLSEETKRKMRKPKNLSPKG